MAFIAFRLRIVAHRLTTGSVCAVSSNPVRGLTARRDTSLRTPSRAIPVACGFMRRNRSEPETSPAVRRRGRDLRSRLDVPGATPNERAAARPAFHGRVRRRFRAGVCLQQRSTGGYGGAPRLAPDKQCRQQACALVSDPGSDDLAIRPKGCLSRDSSGWKVCIARNAATSRSRRQIAVPWDRAKPETATLFDRPAAMALVYAIDGDRRHSCVAARSAGGEEAS